MKVKMIILSFISILCMLTCVKTDSDSCPDICVCLGQLVDCSNKYLNEIPKDLPLWVQSLDMSSNQLNSNISEDISSFMLLNALKLNKNSLTSIPVQSILWNLTDLNLAHNKIVEIGPEFMANLPNLKVLDLSNNYISKIRSEIFLKASNLNILNLNNNKIAYIEKGGLDGLVRLTEFKLNRNYLSHLHDNIFRRMSNLKTLDLNRNKFSEIQSLVFNGLENLTVLRIRQNFIQDLQDGAFFGLHTLTALHLDYNNISNVSKGWLYGLSSLHHLSLNHNKIRNLEGVWELCKQLNDLELSNNLLHTIEKNSFEFLSKLQRLHLNNNLISYIAEGAFNNTPSLKSLELNSNKISWTIEDMQGAFVGLQRLVTLDLSNNAITSISEKAFVGLNTLTNLDLSSNAINTIHKNAFSAVPKLEILSLNTSSLICDCGLGWFPLWLLQAQVELDNIFCAYPKRLKGKLIATIQQEEFVCSPNDYPKPQITKDPVSQVALAGGNVSLSCYAKSSSDTQMNFKWKRNNQDINTEDIIELDIADRTVHTSVLHLNNVTFDHSAQYQCVVSNEFGTVYSRKADLSVLVFPVLVKRPVNVTVKASSTARLACSATGHPTPQIAWQKDGGNDFPAAQERRVHYMPMDDILFIVNVKSADTGVYSCIAKNEAGVVIANATLTVLEPPSFVKKMEDKEVKIGSNIVLECMASGSPKPKLHWTKDGSYLQITDRHFFSAEDQLLIVMNTVLSDSGTYQCELTNSLGTNKGESHLTVLPLYEQRVNEEDLTGVIIITVVCCAVGTSAIWVIIIYQTRKRLNTPSTGLERIAKTKTFHLDTKSELSSSSKDSGTGDSTKRSHEDLLLGTVNCFHQFNEDNEGEATVPEVSLPLLTSFHPAPVIVPCCHAVARNCTPTTETADTCKCQSGSPEKTIPQRTDHDRQHSNSYVCVYIPPPD